MQRGMLEATIVTGCPDFCLCRTGGDLFGNLFDERKIFISRVMSKKELKTKNRYSWKAVWL